jgi:hypothetical protein
MRNIYCRVTWDWNFFFPCDFRNLKLQEDSGSLTETVNYSYQVYKLNFKYACLFVNNLQLHLTTC